MIVDSHQLVRRGLAAMLNAEDDLESCGEVSSTAAAMDEILQRQPDVVLIDVSLRHGAGLELIQRIRALAPQVRVVALAMYNKPEYAERLFSVGAAAFVLKGDLTQRLLEAVRRKPGETPKRGESAEKEKASRGRSGPTRANGLNEVEREIVELIGRGVPARAIALRLRLSVSAVQAYRRRIRGKLNFPTATQLVQFCVRWADRHQALVSQS